MHQLSDEAYVIEALFSIADKDGRDVDFRLNNAQRKVDAALTGRDLIPKARQEGVSSYFLARNLVRCLHNRNTRAVVISHDKESTQRMLKRVHYYIETIKGPRPKIKNMSVHEITFPKTNSMFYIGTAGARKFGRGDTITDLHCSEYAFWPNPKDLMAGLLQAVPKSGRISVESTGNGLNDYHRRCMRAAAGNSAWGCIFLPWQTFSEYTLHPTEEEQELFLANLNLDLEEDSLVGQLTVGQLMWRRVKLEEMDFDLSLFKQEYPMTLDECFQMSGRSIFHFVNFKETPRWERVNADFWLLKGHPRADLTYAAGADVSGGVGADSSVLEIFCLETHEQVGEYINNRIDPEQFGLRLRDYCSLFGLPYLVVENNNHGILTLSVLDKIYPRSKLHHHASSTTTEEERKLLDLGYTTSKRNKPLMIGRLRTDLAGGLKIYSSILRSQLSTFIEHEGGKLAAQDDCEDDTVMAAACARLAVNPAALIVDSARLARQEKLRQHPFSLDSIVSEMRKKGERFPIRSQAAPDSFKI